MTRVLWLLGPSGAGKSTIGWRAYRELAEAAYVDVDQLGLCHPAPPDDPNNHRVKSSALGALWSGRVRDAFVVSGGPDTRELARRYADLLPGAEITWCRLRAHPDELRARVLARGWMPELADVVGDVAEAFERDDFTDFTVDTGDRAPAAVVDEVLARWRR